MAHHAHSRRQDDPDGQFPGEMDRIEICDWGEMQSRDGLVHKSLCPDHPRKPNEQSRDHRTRRAAFGEECSEKYPDKPGVGDPHDPEREVDQTLIVAVFPNDANARKDAQ